MDEVRRNNLNHSSDEDPMYDSDDNNLRMDIDNNVAAINLNEDERMDNLPVAACLNVPDFEVESVGGSDQSNSGSANHSDNESVANSEDESMVGSEHSNNDNSDNPPVTDSEDDSVDVSDEEKVVDSDDDHNNQNPAVDVDSDFDDDNDVDEFINQLQESFSLNAEAEGYNEPLFAEGDNNLQAVEKFILIVAKALRFKESYKSMITSFKIANLGFNNANFPNSMGQFWTIVNRKTEDFTNVTVCTVCWQQLELRKNRR